MRRAMVLPVMLLVLWLPSGVAAAADTSSGVLVAYCHGAGAGVLELKAPATAGQQDYPGVTLPVVSRITIANSGNQDVTVGGVSSKETITEFELRDKAQAGETLVISAKVDSAVLGLVITSVDNSAIKAGGCPTPSGFNTVKARLGALYTILDGKLQESTNVLTISATIGMMRRGGEGTQAAKVDETRALRLASAGAVPLPPERLGPQAADYRLLGYTQYTTIEVPDSGKTQVTESALRAADIGVAEAFKNSVRTHDLEVGLLYRVDNQGVLRGFANPDTAVTARLAIGASTLRPADPTDPSKPIKGSSPWFYSAAIRFESDYETWGDGNSLRGMLEAGIERYGPYGEVERDRKFLTAALSIPALQAGTKAAVFAFLRLDFSRKGKLDNHKVGVLAEVNLSTLFASGGS